MSKIYPVRFALFVTWGVVFSASLSFAGPPTDREAPIDAAPAKSGMTLRVSPEDQAVQPVEEGKGDGLCGRARTMDRLLSGGGPGAPGGPREGDADTDITHYFLDIEIIPEYDGLIVTDVGVAGLSTIAAQAAVDGLTTFTIDLASNLTVNSVTGNVSFWSRVGSTIVVTLDQPYNAGESFQVAVSYQGHPQDGGWGSFRWWLRNNNLAVGTLSEPFYAKYWWPCKDALVDKATMQMHCTVPNGMVVASNGVLEGTDAVGSDRTKFRWREDYPMVTYLASLAITNYQRYDIVYNYNDGLPRTMPVWCYLYPDHWDFGTNQPLLTYKTGCNELVAMLTKLGQRFGLYPFLLEKYGVAETGGTGGLGANMEHQTCSSMYQVSGYSDIMCHELAHQWWGDAVTCATWYDIWLNEGFASYAEPLYRELKSGGGFNSYLSRVRTRRPSNPDARVYRTDISSTGAIFSTNDVYNKGCWVLHQLRHVMGDAAFFNALADYRAAYFDGSATTAQFTTSFSQSFGRDLGWFVDEWVMNPGSPRYEYAWQAAQSSAQNYVQLQIAQTQEAQGYGLITMPIDIVVTTGLGSTTYVVWSLHATDGFAIPVADVPTAVEVDPDLGSLTVPPTRWVLAKSLAQITWPDPSPTVHCQGDMDDNGAVNGLDIQPFVNALIDANTYPTAWQRGDLNFDGQCNLTDLPLFVETLLGQRACPA